MHDTAFAVAARPARFSILGLPMLPYSIGHELLLLAQSNALLFTDFDSRPANEQRAAIIRAVLVCSQGWKENHKPHRWLRLWSWLNLRNADFTLAIADFKNYRTEGSAFPPVPNDEVRGIIAAMQGEKPRKGRELGSPYLARLYNFVAGFPASEISVHGKTAFDFPMALANFLYLTKLESEGDFSIENRKEAEIKDELAGHRAAVEEEKRKEAEKCQH